MKRRAFFSAFGLGATVGAVAGARQVAAAPVAEARDIHWAKARIAEGHRVRMESWCLSTEQREVRPGSSMISFTVGSVEGVETLDGVPVTGDMLTGPWEIVPQEDYPKPPPPPPEPVTGGTVVLSTSPASGGDIILRGGDGVGTGQGGGIVLITGGS